MIIGTATALTASPRRFARPSEIHGLLDGHPFRLAVPQTPILRDGDVVGLAGTPLDDVFSAHAYANASTGSQGSAGAQLLWAGGVMMVLGLAFSWLLAPIALIPAGGMVFALGVRRRQRARQLQEWTREYRKTGTRPTAANAVRAP